MDKKTAPTTHGVSRRNFIKTSTAAGVAALLSGTSGVFAAGSGKIRVGVIGCGGRGTGAAIDCLNASPDVEIIAMGDLFKDQLDGSLRKIKRDFADRVKVTPETSFAGFDNYKKVLACDIDMVVMAPPPHFRPEHLRASVEAGKHVFMEKPVAVDPAGVRSIIASSEQAEKKGLAIVAGTQRRHENRYLETIKRIHEGAIGDIVGGQCYWNMGELWVDRAERNWKGYKEQGWSDMEWQCRNWLFLAWLSGDHIVEQHIHNIDIINWAIGSLPVKCMGMGGRQVRTDPRYGNIFDHFAIDFEYPDGVRVMSMCRQTSGCASPVAERLVGTKGVAHGHGVIEGANAYRYDGPNPNPYVQEHIDLIDSIRAGKPLNEGRRVAESTLCAIMGRMSAYTGREISLKWVLSESKLDLSPPKYEFGDLAMDPVAVPGQTKLI
jgi:predicted dehydrogenase